MSKFQNLAFQYKIYDEKKKLINVTACILLLMINTRLKYNYEATSIGSGDSQLSTLVMQYIVSSAKTFIVHLVFLIISPLNSLLMITNKP